MSKTNNSIYAITLYRLAPDVWGFDDPARNIWREPFVGDANTLIDRLIADCCATGTTILFGANFFPGARVLHHAGEQDGGNLYRSGDTVGWLCPTLFAYFATAPKIIYLLAQ